MELIRQSEYTECVATSDHYYLFGLFESEFLQRWSGGVPTAFTEQGCTVGGPSSPGAETTHASSRGPREGFLILRPDIDVFRCGEPRTLDSQSLVVRFAGMEAHRASAVGRSMPNQPSALDLEELLAGSDPKAKVTRSVDVVHEADACSGRNGERSFTLFTWEVELDPAPTLASVTDSSAVLVADQVTAITFTPPFEDQEANVRTLVMERPRGHSLRTPRRRRCERRQHGWFGGCDARRRHLHRRGAHRLQRRWQEPVVVPVPPRRRVRAGELDGEHRRHGR